MFALGIGSFALVLMLMPLVQRVAVLHGVTDDPSPRKLHATPVPYLGGVAIAVAAVFASAFLRGWRAEAAVIVLGALLVGVVGLIDDLRNLNPAPRLLAETFAAGLAALAGARVHLFGGPIDWILTALWLVILTNAFNLLDNMDGAAGAIAAITATALALTAGFQGQWLVGGLAAVLAGCSSGFLLHNWPPARIFMGDAGSLFVGYLLAAIVLKLRFPVAHGEAFVAAALFLLPAIYDTSLVVFSRLLGARPVFQGGTDHTSHRLLRLGFSTRQAAGVLAGASAVSVTLAFLVGRGIIGLPIALGPVLLFGATSQILFLRMQVYLPAAAVLEG
jgi:UDP-GlcNAc:undecaprenyl-phosphate GlcNAc-1-phosphate transferase